MLGILTWKDIKHNVHGSKHASFIPQTQTSWVTLKSLRCSKYPSHLIPGIFFPCGFKDVKKNFASALSKPHREWAHAKRMIGKKQA